MMDWNLIPWIFCILVTIGFLYYLTYKLLKYKKEILELRQLHEKEMKEQEWQRKLEWEAKLSGKSDKVGELESALAGKESEIGGLKSQLERSTQLDIERVALLIHSFSGNTEPITSEKMAKMVKQLKETQNAIKEYLK